MGRRKQNPHRSGGIFGALNVKDCISEEQPENADCFEHSKEIVEPREAIYLEIDRSFWDSDQHFDIAEVVLIDVRVSDKYSDHKLLEDSYQESNFSLRFKFYNEEHGNFKLGQCPMLSANNVSLEFVVLSTCDENGEVVLSGILDGPDEGVSGLVHLVSQKLLTLRPVLEIRVLEKNLCFRARIEILKKAFEACGSLLENTRLPWKKSMMNVMAWLRPEVTTEEAKYGICKSKIVDYDSDMHPETTSSFSSRKRARFDAAGFYEAIKPSKDVPMLENEFPDLLPQLRPYQRRAAFWMVQQEKGDPDNAGKSEQTQLVGPLCVPVDFIDRHFRMFYNPFCGNVSMNPEIFSSRVSGGILADEMGLGKTLELLACIFAHRKPSSEEDILSEIETKSTGIHSSNTRRLKWERVECVCGAVNESLKYKGLWVQCDVCDAWQHADCVGYKPRGMPSFSNGVSEKTGHKEHDRINLKTHSKEKNIINIIEKGGSYVCLACFELSQAADTTTTTGATLIVCPTPILPQWHAEIARHTQPGSLKTLVYEGVRSFSSSTTTIMDMDELATADIVLTTYDVLREDLSHDSDRHDGDRRFMRFQKRYPVVPTLLTRIFWWRICLDEAQMVESNAAASTEMAMRLRARHHWCITGTPIQRRIDDMYGLLRFLRASPFDVHRWWIEVIRDPYERGDVGAMEFTHNYFKQIMWRSSKAHVADELQLPPQEECMSWLTFSPIEAHFYQRQHETCVGHAQEVIAKFKGSDVLRESFFSHGEATKLLNSLLKLRQACCHPQVGGSGLRTLQQSPMTMEEILMVLVGKAKTEGEEALRKLVVALNGLAGIAIIERDPTHAVSLYREALDFAEANSNDFRLDPLLNLHILYNLSELLSPHFESSQKLPSTGYFPHPEDKIAESSGSHESDQYSVKRQKLMKDCCLGSSIDDSITSDGSKVGVNGGMGKLGDDQCQVLPGSSSYDCLRAECKNIKQKYLSMFVAKLSLAQKEFNNLYTQVCGAITECKEQHSTWWLEALDLVEQNESTKELIKKINEGLPGDESRSRIASRFRSISGLKYLIQTGIDSLEESREELLGRLLEIDETMEKPSDVDIERVRYCSKCQANGDGPLCVHCELDQLFQAYEARLFLLTKGDNGEMIASAEEALDLQKQKSALNRFFGGLSQDKKKFPVSDAGNEDNRRHRHAKANVVISRSPSELEVILGTIKNFSKARVGRDCMPSGAKQLHLFEVMRREYAQARSLSIAQAQILRAHDEIKMASSRLRLREAKDDASAIDTLSSEELVAASVQFSSEKFIAVSTLSRIKGQLRYLKGLTVCKQRVKLNDYKVSSMPEHQNITSVAVSAPNRKEQLACLDKTDDDACPVCHERLGNQRMVFQCGHVTCCKCLIAMTEHVLFSHGKSHDKWVMCPTCRQHTEFGNIAYANDSHNGSYDSWILNKSHGLDNKESSIYVQGSYGTKIEAVTRRILWIRSTDPNAKVLVFSSWSDVLDVLEHALDANSISYIRMKGGRKSHVAIKQFKGGISTLEGTRTRKEQRTEPKSVQVLLLLIQHGANGLNLLEAQHVMLIEPLLNPAAEAQAINRVHRIGQKKATFVHRFIVKDTVEKSIYKLNRSKLANSIINGNSRNQDEQILTLKDLESLFSAGKPAEPAENGDEPIESLRQLPPAVAAALAAEKRLKLTQQEHA